MSTPQVDQGRGGALPGGHQPTAQATGARQDPAAHGAAPAGKARHQAWPALPPGSWLGVLGGGQLGRMFCQAAQRLGYRVCVLDPEEDCIAGRVADRHLRADYLDERALAELGRLCAAVTTEFENVPVAALNRLAELTWRFYNGINYLGRLLNKESIKPFETAGINAKIIENQIVMNDTSESTMNSKTLAKNKSYHIMSKK